MEYLSVKVSDYVITTNKSLKNIVIKRCNINPRKVIVVRNGPDKNFRDKHNIKEYKKGKNHIVSYFGIMGQADGVENVIYAADYIYNQRKIDNIDFILIGYGDQFNYLNQLTEDKGLVNKVVFTNRIPFGKVKEIILASDICLAPDPKNGLNEFHTMNKIADYMAYGKPIVSFDLHETKYTAGDAAVYIDNNDSINFADAIIELIKNPDKRKNMGDIGLRRLENYFTWEHSEKTLIKLYNRLLNLKTAN